MPALLTTAQVATDLGITPERIRQLAKSRKLGALYGNTMLFTPKDVDAMKVRTPGRPRKDRP